MTNLSSFPVSPSGGLHRARLSALTCRLFSGSAVWILCCFGRRAVAAPSGEVDFSRDVRPILAAHCLKCHGPDDEARKAKLRLDVRELALKPAKSGDRPIVPGKPDQSELVRRIFAKDEDDRMPPPSAKNPLTDSEKEMLKRWISDGAKYETHWAWLKPVQQPLPPVQDASWPRNPIDYFVLARLEKEGLKPSPEADQYSLVRRVYLDLIGLPPTPAEADAFVQNSSPDAYERLVETLLSSPRYGERWARRWLDLARYADTNGYEKDRPRSIWAWRDWVVRALNEDMPFDQFTIKQLAGDMLPHPAADDLIATGFNRNSMLNEEGGIDPLEFRFYAMVDRVHVTATTWLGLTLQCAQCHTHKFDPIQHQEYYQFMAFLNNADEPTFSLPDPKISAKRHQLQAEIDRRQAALIDEFPFESKIEWLTPADAEFTSENGSEAERLEDGSFRVSGPNPDKDNYTVTFHTSFPRVTHLQVEAVPDSQIAGGGPGRTDHGNFVLSEIELSVQPSGGQGDSQTVRFSAAQADYSQAEFPVANAIDGKTDTGWAVDGSGDQHLHHEAIFTLAAPLTLEPGARLSVRLVQQFGKHHTLGRFRISLGSELPDPQPLAERRRANRDRHFAKWVPSELAKLAHWQRVRPVEAKSQVPSLDVEEDDSIFASGDFTKSDTYTLRFRDLPAGTTAIRLEALPDERLPGGGPGRVYYEGEPGDFFLSNLKAMVDGKRIGLTNATESFANDHDTAAKAIDNDLQSGWSIRGEVGHAHSAVFQLARPITGQTNELEMAMTFERYYASALGRFRIWVTTNENAQASGLPNELREALLIYQGPQGIQTLLTSPEAAADRDALLRYYVQVAPELADERKEIAKLRSEMPRFPTTLVMRERSPEHPRITHVHHRGEFLQAQEAVSPGVPSFLPPLPPDAPRNRLGLAEWLVSPENPLTARVVVNRDWEAFFGRGLVRTTEDFGFQGDLPSHPELLDWLAVQFMKDSWSQKAIQRLIVTSATYRQASRATPELVERDPDNILLARGPRVREEAEIIRDAALAASGLLSEKIGGPSVFPPQPPGVTTEGAYGQLQWKVSPGGDRFRRGLYTFAKRTAPFAMTVTFDGPSGEACLARRDRSNTPLQALTLLNDTVFMECARALGRQAAQRSGDANCRAEELFRRCLTRPPSPEERDRIVHFYEVELERFKKGDLKSDEFLTGGTEENSNEQAAWTAVARVILNLDEMITKG
jgi:hypothetical protein